ncbi:MAG: hypothetical protein ACK443_01910 [Methylococcaceae bacterium]|jgi:hypothetical protein
MSRDAVLDQLKIDIETYSAKLKSSFFNDQSKFRKQQAKTLIALIAEAQR